MFFGHETTLNDDYPNVYVHNEEPDTAKIEMLQVLEKEVRTNAKTAGDCEHIIALVQLRKLH